MTTKTVARRSKPKLRLSAGIARDLGASILSGRYRPGDLLEGEVEASARLGVSRTAYREAMSMLSAKGLLEMRQRAGTRVRPMDQWHWLDSDVLRWLPGHSHASRARESLFELRKAVEPDIVLLAAQRHTTVQLRAMERALQKMRNISVGQREHETSRGREFRALLFTSSNNLYLAALGHTIDQIATLVESQFRTHNPMWTNTDGYAQVFSAVSSRQAAQARAVMAKVIELERLSSMEAADTPLR